MSTTLTWLSLLPWEIDSIKEVKEPNSPIRPGERIIGEIQGDLRKLYTLMMQVGYESEKIKVDLTYGSEATPHRVEEFARLCRLDELLTLIFWFSVKDNLNCWYADTIGVRSGWKIVEIQNPVMEGFKKIFGM